MTYREYVQKNYPECIAENCGGGVKGCPGHYIDGAITHYSCSGKCGACFDARIGLNDVDAKTGKRVYPYEFIEEES